ncbi:mechanosensitive ion channel [Aestuariibacter sp. AA17]|uniref:Small-conductance mechanosensitive channel n=1 Tax=Fluctibacter corallii TaxID=2984329 RepID=A0ABT3A490_9ALTE|nr:mechanosensitive ion channel domain-containing protein [Aestuariibacter sp. AA17]MCV2883481.1 mechanosensitive ion channel [Aestuariibacter sp. AA17]
MIEEINITELVETYIIPFGIDLLMALAIFVLGRIVASILVNILGRVLSKSKYDEMLISFICSIVSAILLLVVIVASLDQLGVDTTSIVALVGAAGLAIGLSLQDSLKNFASGVMLFIFRPFKQGDFVEAGGVSGTVRSITVFTTMMTTPDNKEIIVPNGKIYGNNITNFSAKPTRRVDMVFGISYDSDLREAKALLETMVKEDERILEEPAPVVAVSELADSSVNFVVRPWVNASDYWAVKFDLTEKVKLRFDEAGIVIPYPQMDVYLHKEDEPEKNADQEEVKA